MPEVTEKTRRHPSPKLIRAAFRIATMATAVCAALAVPTAEATPATAENAAAAAAVHAMTDGVATTAEQIAAIPPDFRKIQGYHPVAGTDYAIDSNGVCSSPIELPERFNEPCIAHDLGYDLLRYAAEKGGPLGTWARDAIDETMYERMNRACDNEIGADELRCRVLATTVYAAVRANSYRQSSSVPVREEALDRVQYWLNSKS